MDRIAFLILGGLIAIFIIMGVIMALASITHSLIAVICGLILMVSVFVFFYYTNPPQEQLSDILIKHHKETVISVFGDVSPTAETLFTNALTSETYWTRFNFGWVTINDISIGREKFTYLGFVGRYIELKLPK